MRCYAAIPAPLKVRNDFSNHSVLTRLKIPTHKGGSIEYTPNPELEKLRTEKKQNEKKIEQLDHRIQRLENRIKYYKDADRKKRTHRLCTVAGTLESIAPEIKELDITEVMELLEHIFHKEEIQKLVHRMKINHDSKVRRAKEG